MEVKVLEELEVLFPSVMMRTLHHSLVESLPEGAEKRHHNLLGPLVMFP